MQISTTDIIILLLVSIVGAGLGYYYFIRRKKKYYDTQRNIAILEDLRSTLEKQIYSLNDRLIKNEERWLDVNHLLVNNSLSNPIAKNSNRTYYSDFLKSNGIFENDLILDDKFIFILTPFNDSYRESYLVIRDTCAKAGFTCIRGDERQITGDIFPEMLRYIVKAKLIIANINGRNPNVMYELGIAHALDKPVLLVSRDVGKLPVDLKSKRFLIYDTYNELETLLREELFNTLA